MRADTYGHGEFTQLGCLENGQPDASCYQRDCQQMLHLKVNLPRILLFKSINVTAGLFKWCVVAALGCLAVFGVMRVVSTLCLLKTQYALRPYSARDEWFVNASACGRGNAY